MKKLLVPAAIAAVVAASPVAAQSAVESLGEASSVFSCFYECERGLGTRTDWWGETTVLVLENQNALADVNATVILLDGHEQMIAQMPVPLSNEDVDMIHVCRTLQSAGVIPPRGGAIEVILRNPQNTADAVGVYGWVKSFVGKFFIGNNDPFLGVVNGVGTTGCRVTPPSVATVAQILQKIGLQSPPVVQPVYVSDTGE